MAKNNNTNQDGFTVKNLEKAFNNAGESRPNTFILSKKQLELLKKEGIDINPDKLQDISGDDIYPELNGILSDYHINMICCRRILLSSVNFHELINKIHLAGSPQN